MNVTAKSNQITDNDYILNSISDAVIVTDLEGKITYWNKAAEDLYKWNSEEVINKNIEDIIPSKASKRKVAEMMLLLKKGNSWEGDFEVKNKNGKVFHMHLKNSPLTDEKGNFIGIIVSSRIMSEEIKYHEIAKEKEEKFKILADNTFDWEYWIDQSGNYIYMSPACKRITGYSRDDFIKNPNLLFKITTGKYKEQVKNHYKEITESEPHTEEFKIISKNNKEVWIEHSCIAVYDRQGVFKGRRGINRDITKQKNAEIKLKYAEENLRNTFDVSPSIICNANLNTGYFIKVNPAVTSILGYSQEEFASTPVIEFIHPDDRQETMDEISKQLIGEDTISFENRYLCKNGSYKWMAWNATAADENGIITAIGSDINKRKIADIELIKTKLDAEEKEEKYKAITENIPGMVYRANSDWSANTISNSYSITGFSEKEFLSAKVNWQNLIHPEDKDKVFSESDVLTKREAGLRQEYRIVTKENNVRHVADYKRSIFKNGKLAFIYGVVLDITIQHEHEQKLKLSDRVFNLSLDMFCIAGFDGYFKYLNPAWEKTLGWSVNELLSKPWLEFVHPDDKDKTANAKTVIVDGKEVYQFENRYICKDGSVKWLSWNAQPFPEDNVMIGAVRDITKSKKIEKEIIKAREKADKYIEMILSSQSLANICSYSTNLIEEDLEKSVWECSPEFYKIFGIDETYPHTIAGWAGFIHPDFREEMLAYHEYVVRDRISFNKEYKIIRIKDGEERWVHGTGELVYDENDKPVRMHGAIQDITELREVTEKLIKAKDKSEESEEKFKLLNRLTSEMLLIQDLGSIYKFIAENLQKHLPNTIVIYVSVEDSSNQARLEVISGMNNSFLKKVIKHLRFNPIGKNFKLTDLHNNYFKTGKFIEFSGGLVEFSDSEFPTLVASTIEKLIGLDKIYTIGINKDNELFGAIHFITFNKQIISDGSFIEIFAKQAGLVLQKKINEKDLEKAREKAEESELLKSAFLANMSHEIRTPMNGILGFTSLLQEHDLTGEQQQQYIEIIRNSGNRMLITINDIIEISKIDAGQIRVNSNKLNISKHLINLQDFFKLEAEKKGLKLIIDNKLSKDGDFITTDKNKLDSILTNLIKNAIKFTEKGSVKIAYTRKDNFIEFSVKDTGIGVSPERKDAIFNRFEQADIEDKQVKEGSGLGLAISKAYVEMLSGKIWVDSKPGEGSQFYFTIPYNPAHKEIS